jgi:tetratricopeptide (TPR) repeat protein
MTEVVPISLGHIGARKPMRRGVPAMAWYARGCALEAGAPEAALAAYTRAVAGQPDLADAWNNAGRLLHDRGDVAAAEGSYRLAICGDASVALYWFNLGVAIEDQGGRTAEAIAAYEQAVALDPGRGDAHYNLARLYEQVARAGGEVVWAHRAVRHYLQYRQLERARSHRPIFR